MKKPIILFLSFCLITIGPLFSQNNALNFDGVDDYVACGDINPSSFTLEAWVKPYRIDEDQAIISMLDGANSTGMELHLFTDGRPVLTIRNGSAWGNVFANYTLPANEWVHLAATFDGSNCKMYVNGVDLTLDPSTAVYTPVVHQINIGRRSNNYLFFKGSIDEVRIWNTARTASEIANAMHSTISHPADTTELIAYYPCNQGTAFGNNTTIASLTDYSASNTNGALYNFTSQGTTSNVAIGAPVGETYDYALTYVPSSISVYTGASYKIRMGDFNNDGKPDIAEVNNSEKTITISLGDGLGGFTKSSSLATEIIPSSPIITDLNGDGNMDVLCLDAWYDDIRVFMGKGDGTFSDYTDYDTGGDIVTSSSAIDYNGDGKVDLVIGNTFTSSMFFLPGNGDGTFATKTEKDIGMNSGVFSISDFNTDGKVDFVVYDNTNKKLNLFLGDGTGDFSLNDSLSLGSFTNRCMTADLNNDGNADIISWYTSTNVISIFFGNGDGTFSDKTDYNLGNYVSSLEVYDFNGDGKLDFETHDVNTDPNQAIFWKGKGDGTFERAESTFTFSSRVYGVTVGDFDCDGKIDWLASLSDNSKMVMMAEDAPTVSSDSINTIASYSATGHGNMTDLGYDNVVQHGFVWSTATNPTIALATKTEEGTSSAVGLFSSDITGLHGGITYYTRAYATNSAGTAYGEEWSFSTIQTVPDAPTDVLAIARNSEATIKFAAPISNGGSDITEYTITSAPEGKSIKSTESPVLFTGLSNGTAYTFVVIATNALGNSAGSNVSNIITPHIPPVITSFAPTSGPVGTTVIISGTGFSTTPSDNSVYFGDVKANVSQASETSLTLTIPTGAGSLLPLSLTIGNMVAYSNAITTPFFLVTNTPTLSMDYSVTVTETTDWGSPFVMEKGDFNNDGKPDLVIGINSEEEINVYLGKGDGTFQPEVRYACGKNPRALAIGDFNGDGHTDIVSANNSSNSISVFIGQGDGTFAPHADYATGSYPKSVDVGDFNKDGKLDLVVANRGDGNLGIYMGYGDGTFATKVDHYVGSILNSVAVGDFNGDQTSDFAVIRENTSKITLIMGNGDGTFGSTSSYTINGAPSKLSVGDLNGDTHLDIATSNNSSYSISVLLSDGNGGFSASTEYTATGYPNTIAMGDFNGDGVLDISTTHRYNTNGVNIFMGMGNGTFAAKKEMNTDDYISCVAFADFNCDGKTDWVTTTSEAFAYNKISVMLQTDSTRVTTEAVSSIDTESATGNGTITRLGYPASETYGVCWSTTENPTIASFKTETTVYVTGAFVSSITGLTPNTTYYVRAYVTDLFTTYYGEQQSFNTGMNTSVNNAILEEIRLYPNPTSSQVFVESDEEIESIILFSITGSGVPIDFNSKGSGAFSFDVSKMASGTYFFQITTASTTLVEKVVVK